MFFTVTLRLSKVTVQSLSTSTGTKSRGFLISLKTVAFRAGSGRVGSCKLSDWIDAIVLLFAHLTMIGSCGSLVPEQPGGTKCPVAAVSGKAVEVSMGLLSIVSNAWWEVGGGQMMPAICVPDLL